MTFTPLQLASSPGMTEMVLSARSTLNVLKADTLPRSTNSVTYLQQARRQKHKNTHTQKGVTTLSKDEPTQRDRRERETEQRRAGMDGQQPETRSARKGKSDGRSCSQALLRPSHLRGILVATSQSSRSQNFRCRKTRTNYP